MALSPIRDAGLCTEHLKVSLPHSLEDMASLITNRNVKYVTTEHFPALKVSILNGPSGHISTSGAHLNMVLFLRGGTLFGALMGSFYCQ